MPPNDKVTPNEDARSASPTYGELLTARSEPENVPDCQKLSQLTLACAASARAVLLVRQHLSVALDHRRQ